MKHRDYVRKRSELDTDYRTKVAALETVWALFHPDEPPPSVGSEDMNDADLPVSRRKAVRDAVSSLENSFTVKEVRMALDVLHPAVSRATDDNQLSSLVARLAGEGFISVVRERSGRSPGVYANEPTEGKGAKAVGDD